VSAARLLAAGTRAIAALVGLLGVRRALAWARERSMAMMESIRRASYIHEVGRLTDEVARATSSGYIRGLRATSFSMVCLVARASSRLSQLGSKLSKSYSITYFQYNNIKYLKVKQSKKLKSSKYLIILRLTKFDLFMKLLEYIIFLTVLLLEDELNIFFIIYHISNNKYIMKLKNGL